MKLRTSLTNLKSLNKKKYFLKWKNHQSQLWFQFSLQRHSSILKALHSLLCHSSCRSKISFQSRIRIPSLKTNKLSPSNPYSCLKTSTILPTSNPSRLAQLRGNNQIKISNTQTKAIPNVIAPTLASLIRIKTSTISSTKETLTIQTTDQEFTQANNNTFRLTKIRTTTMLHSLSM